MSIDDISNKIKFVDEKLTANGNGLTFTFSYAGQTIPVVCNMKNKTISLPGTLSFKNHLSYDLMKEVLTPLFKKHLEWEHKFVIMDKDSIPTTYME